MRVFALDTSSKVATVAIVEDQNIVVETVLKHGLTHSENLMPLVAETFQRAGFEPKEMDLFAVTRGPGGFTGLRIGVSTIKGLAEGVDKPVVSLDTMEVLAHTTAPTNRLIVALLDAQRDRVYRSIYRYEKNELINLKETEIMDLSSVIEEVKGIIDRGVFFLGDGYHLHQALIEEAFGGELSKSHQGNHLPRASALGFLAMEKAKKEGTIKAGELRVAYLRKSQAELQHEEKMKRSKDEKKQR